MIMKKIIYLTLMFLAATSIFAQTNADEHEWKATVKVVDENGSPVAKANTSVNYYTNNTTVSIDGSTDTNGIFVATHVTSTINYALYKLIFVIEKEGYYRTWSQCDLGLNYDLAKWNPTVTLTLKKVVKPIAMYAKWVRKNPPVFNQPVGYDLMAGDWVGPDGKGVQTDIIFQADDYRKSGTDYQHNMTVTFPKTGDGIQIYAMSESETGSGLRSPHEAPLGGYEAKLTRETYAHPGLASKFEYDPNRIYLFRVRTALDHNGNVVSAHYGKIYGDFMQFSYYLNPTPNDRNIEFDPKQNLLGGLQSFERVSAP
jgi:hypothetical protein